MMREFGAHFDAIQSGILEREYDARVNSPCSCGKSLAHFRCEQCFQLPPSCSDCAVASHLHSPFHHIQEWRGSHFVRTSLKALGHIIALGHSSSKCPNAPIKLAVRSITVVHTNGIHKYTIEFCHCFEAANEPLQMISAGLFPATMDHPETAFTIQLLEEYEAHTLASKKSAFDYFSALVNLTDNVFPGRVLVSNNSLTKYKCL